MNLPKSMRTLKANKIVALSTVVVAIAIITILVVAYNSEIGSHNTFEKTNELSVNELENKDFVFAFYSEIAEEDKKSNIFFSPLSISTAFSMAYEGAKENTASEMRQVFGFEPDDVKRQKAISEMSSMFNHKDGWYNLQVANALWIKDGYEIKQTYLDTVKNHYSGNADSVDFVTDDGINKINSWVKQNTKNKIQDILAPNSTDEMTRMIITNAVYFNGKWSSEFNPKNTSEKPFWTDKDNSAMVSMMRQSAGIYNYADVENIQALELDYLGGDISMIVLLPKDRDGIEAIEEHMDGKKFNAIKERMTRQSLSVEIPKFEFETKYNLKVPLQSLGLQDAFDKDNANFQGITKEQVYLDRAAHKAFVNVNEEGTEAAAITALVMRNTSGPPEPVAEFVADHPFMFVIQEKNTGEILFVGRLVNP